MMKIKDIIKEKGLKIPEENNYPIIEYDKKGNIIHYKNSDGDEYWKEGKNLLELKEGKYYLNGKLLIKKVQEK